MVRMSEDSKIMPKNYVDGHILSIGKFLDLCIEDTKGFEFYKVKRIKRLFHSKKEY